MDSVGTGLRGLWWWSWRTWVVLSVSAVVAWAVSPVPAKAGVALWTSVPLTVSAACLALAQLVARKRPPRPARRGRPDGFAPPERGVVGNLPTRPAAFQPRTIVRTEIDIAWAAGATITLRGDGGVGKSQLARECFRDSSAPWRVWVVASSLDTLVSGFDHAARQLGPQRLGVPGLATETSPEVWARAFHQWLRSTTDPWLVVLDDVDVPPARLAAWWPEGPAGTVLATTRRHDGDYDAYLGRHVDVDVYTEDEAVTYLTERLREHRHPPRVLVGIRGLARDLGYHPVALAVAAGVMNDNKHLTATKFQKLLADQAARLRDVFPDRERPGSHADVSHAQTIGATWGVAVERAALGSPLAEPVAGLVAFSHPTLTPHSLFATKAVRAHLAAVAGAPVTGDQARYALTTLERVSLVVTPFDEHDPIQVHSVAQWAIRDLMSDAQRDTAARVMADATVELWPTVEDDPDVVDRLRAVADVLCKVALAALVTDRVHPVVFRAGELVGESGNVTDAVAFYERVLTQVHLGPDDHDTLTVRANLARWRGESGNPAGAAAELEQVLDDRLKVLGPDHPDTLSTRSHLAGWRGAAGDPVGAVNEYEHLLDDQLRALGPQHPDILTTRHHLAWWHGESGDPERAAAEYEKLLVDRGGGSREPTTRDILVTRSNLAWWRGEAGDPHRAVGEYEQILADRLRVLGPDHPQTLTTRNNLARWRGEAGDRARAVVEYIELLADRTRVLGPDHPQTLATRHNLARWRGEVGDITQAVADYERLLADRLRVLGARHPDTLTTRHNLAWWRGRAGDGPQAVADYEDLLVDCQQVLAPDHPHTLGTRHNLAVWRGESGDPAGAVADFEQLLADRLRLLGPDHPHTLGTRHNLARWRAKADPSGSVSESRQLLDDRLGPGTYAWWRGLAGDPARAATEFEQLHDDCLRVLGPDHPHTQGVRNSLAGVSHSPRPLPPGHLAADHGSAMPQWDPDLYLAFEKARTQPSIDLAARVDVEAPQRVVDVGCGPGNSTEVLARRWPEAQVVGVDSSAAMLDKARAAHPEWTWVEADATSGLADLGTFDVVFSNAMIQWVDDQESLLRAMFAALRPGGVLAVQVPSTERMPIRMALVALLATDRWRTRLEGVTAVHSRTARYYYDVLATMTSQVELWVTDYMHVMPTHDALVQWYSGTGLRPYLDHLTDDAERSEFLAEYHDLVAAAYQPQRDGNILFPFHRIFFTARAI